MDYHLKEDIRFERGDEYADLLINLIEDFAEFNPDYVNNYKGRLDEKLANKIGDMIVRIGCVIINEDVTMDLQLETVQNMVDELEEIKRLTYDNIKPKSEIRK
jgi:hypothetical protein